MEDGLSGYKEGRNFPALPNVSRLSPHLHWGELSPHMAWYAANDQLDAGAVGHDDADHFMSELGWREFSHMLLYHFPGLPRQNLQPRFDKFPWKQDAEAPMLIIPFSKLATVSSRFAIIPFWLLMTFSMCLSFWSYSSIMLSNDANRPVGG